VKAAEERGAMTIGFAGYQGGKLAQVARRTIIVRSENMQQIEDVHMVLGHLIFTCLMRELA